jgi:type II secretory pathway pseudopilin PulG
MQTHLPSQRKERRNPWAFTVLELLVAVSIMTVIVFALYQMFNQTQKALRGNITQVDVLESGRVAIQMMSQELEQLEPTQLAGATNLYAAIIPSVPRVQFDVDETRLLRTNVLQELFFMTSRSNQWTGIGYRVIGANDGVGTLYRFSSSTNYRRLTSTNLSRAYFLAGLTNPVTGYISQNFERIADGIIHMRLTAFDPHGRRVAYDQPNFYPGYKILRQPFRDRRFPGVTSTNLIVRQDVAQQTGLVFMRDAVPAALELELGVLEPETLAQYNSIREAAVDTAEDFLRKHANKVHVFRHRIPIRTATQ